MQWGQENGTWQNGRQNQKIYPVIQCHAIKATKKKRIHTSPLLCPPPERKKTKQSSSELRGKKNGMLNRFLSSAPVCWCERTLGGRCLMSVGLWGWRATIVCGRCQWGWDGWGGRGCSSRGVNEYALGVFSCSSACTCGGRCLGNGFYIWVW